MLGDYVLMAVLVSVLLILLFIRSNWTSNYFTQIGMLNNDLYKAVKIAGFAYDENQNIYYSTMYPWQRDYGYCRLYDEGSAPFGMIIDCEPIYFRYEKKDWLIEFWKGQYDLCTGGEIGVYRRESTLTIAGLIKSAFYKCATDDELLKISYTLKKDGTPVITREAKHWWLTGFKLGQFSNPSELTMDLSITLKDEIMCEMFVGGLKKAGYKQSEITRIGNTVSLIFDKPRTRQPLTRTKFTDWIIQKKNKKLCELYHEITEPYDRIQDKLYAIEQMSPKLYEKIMNIGKAKQILETYNNIKKHLH